MIFRTSEMTGFEFARVAALRAAQLVRGCTPRVSGHHSPATMAQREVAEGKVSAVPRAIPHRDVTG